MVKLRYSICNLRAGLFLYPQNFLIRHEKIRNLFQEFIALLFGAVAERAFATSHDIAIEVAIIPEIKADNLVKEDDFVFVVGEDNDFHITNFFLVEHIPYTSSSMPNLQGYVEKDNRLQLKKKN